MLDFLRQNDCSRLVCCGDIVGYGPDPAACIESLRANRVSVVCGNHDAAAVGRKSTDDFSTAAAQAIVWTRGVLRDDDVLFLENLPLTERLNPFLFVHGAPGEPEAFDYILSIRDAQDALEDCTDRLCIVGHTHQPLVAELVNGEPLQILRPDRFIVRDNARYLVNVGSVGQPRDGDPRACCAIYDTASGEFSFHRLPYDVTAVQSRIRSAGLPEFLAARLASGC